MLSHLHILDFAIAPELELEFGPGFTVITGETGAGKSILVDALGLLLGDRSDASWVRAGSEKAELSAEFDLAGNAAAQAWLGEAELDGGDRCLLRRSIASNGRSRAWINGTPVTVQQLAQLGELLVELHGQNEHLRLTRAGEQLRLLDANGVDRETLLSVRDRYRAWRELESESRELAGASALSPQEQDVLRYQVEELNDQALDPEALAELEREHQRLSHSGELLETLGACVERLAGDDAGLVDELFRLGSRLEALQAYDPGVAEACRMLQEAAINAQEASASLRHALDQVDLSPDRLELVRTQLGRLGDLARKHHVPLERLPEVRDQLAERLERAEHYEQLREGLQARVSRALADYRDAAAALSRERIASAGQLASQVTALMSELGMAGGVFQVDVHHDPDAAPSARGDDRVELRVSANPGFPPGPMSRIASGGELSRLGLAIKVAASDGAGRTQVFDEIDAGIGGDTANAVGQLLRRLAEAGQALCVTHLAQVAVCAGHQVRVDKQTGADRVEVGTQVLDPEQRVEEIARMLSGRASAQSLAHARELLSAVEG